MVGLLSLDLACSGVESRGRWRRMVDTTCGGEMVWRPNLWGGDGSVAEEKLVSRALDLAVSLHEKVEKRV